MVLLPVAYVLRPIFWTPLDNRFYNYFNSKRSVSPWTEVVVVAIDEATRAHVFDNPIYPLSRHVDKHARLTEQLEAAGVRAVVFDLRLTEEDFDKPPDKLVDAFHKSENVYLVMSLIEKRNVNSNGKQFNVLQGITPHPELLAASRGAYVVDMRFDPDGILRRFRPDPRIEKLDLETLPEHLADFYVAESTPIEFPSENRPMPTVSYRDVYRGDEGIRSILRGRIAFVGSVLDETTDYVDVPRLQSLEEGQKAFLLPGVSTLAAITETLLRGAPIRDAPWLVATAWNLLWCMAAIVVMPRERPIRAALLFFCVLLASLFTTGLLHSYGGVVFPAGLLLGCLTFSGAFTLISSYIETAKKLVVVDMENENRHKELERARRTQERFLPKNIPIVAGYDVWGVNISSLEVSGDYFDVVDLGESRPLVIVIADVSGKGLPAALIMSNVQAGLHSHFFQKNFCLLSTIRNLNRLICENTDEGVFVTMFLAELDKASGVLRYVRAGHDMPFIVSNDESVQILDSGGLMLGVKLDYNYEIGEVQLGKGDVLCLYTDGVTEARNANGDEFQIELLMQVMKMNRGKQAKEMVEQVLLSVKDFAGRSHQDDDVTVVVLRADS